MNQEQIPLNWKYLPVRALAISRNKSINPKQYSETIFADYSMPAYDKGEGPILAKGSQIESNRNVLLSTTTVLINKLNVRKERIWFIEKPAVNAVCTSEFVPLYPKKGTNGAFLRYALLSNEVTQKLISISNGSTNSQVRVKPNDILSLKILVPALEVQNSISCFLNARNANIDEAISRHRQAIDKLEEYRRAVVVKAVTKGLDCSVPMKDSGVAWIGMIPSSWDVKRIKFVARLASGGTPSRDHPEYWEGNIPWVTTGDLNGTKVTATMENITQLGLENSSSKVFSSGTVLVAMYGGAGTIGKCGILGGDFAINQALCAIQCYCGLDPHYLLYQMHAIRPYWMRHAAGTRKDPNISQALIANEKIVIPPYADQLKIVSELNSICSAVDDAIDRQNQTIEKLEEYRRSLIHAAVTGRIDCTKEPL